MPCVSLHHCRARRTMPVRLAFLLCSKICMVSGIFALPYPVPHRPADFFAQTGAKPCIPRLNVQDAVPGSGGKN